MYLVVETPPFSATTLRILCVKYPVSGLSNTASENSDMFLTKRMLTKMRCCLIE